MKNFNANIDLEILQSWEISQINFLTFLPLQSNQQNLEGYLQFGSFSTIPPHKLLLLEELSARIGDFLHESRILNELQISMNQ